MISIKTDNLWIYHVKMVSLVFTLERWYLLFCSSFSRKNFQLSENYASFCLISVGEVFILLLLTKQFHFILHGLDHFQNYFNQVRKTFRTNVRRVDRRQNNDLKCWRHLLKNKCRGKSDENGNSGEQKFEELF